MARSNRLNFRQSVRPISKETAKNEFSTLRTDFPANWM